MHDLEALGLELLQQRGERDRGRVLEIVHQDDTLAALFELGHHRCDHLVGVLELEVEGIDVDRKDADVPFREISGQFRRLAQPWEAEKGRQRTPGGDRDGADAVLDFILGFRQGFLGQVHVRPRMGSDGVILGDNLPEDVGMPAHMLADRKKCRLQALRRQRRQHGRRIAGPWAVVEGQHDLARFQEIVGLEH
jgi:hypothetical protein